MPRFAIISAGLLGLTIIGGCSPQSKDQLSAIDSKTGVYHKISAKEAKQMIDDGNVIIVDVRREDEYAQEHIPSAILVPNEDLLETAEAMLPDKNTPLLVYCRSGNRSAQAAYSLLSLGYTNVYDFGSIIDWPYETESGDSSSIE